MAGSGRSTLIRGRPVKRDADESNGTVMPAKPARNSPPEIVDLDDVPDEAFVQSETKRKKAPPRASGKKQKVAAAAAAQTPVRGDDDDSGLLGDVEDDVTPAKVVEPEELDKDDVECSFIESSRIPSHVAKKDYPHRYVENDGQVPIFALSSP